MARLTTRQRAMIFLTYWNDLECVGQPPATIGRHRDAQGTDVNLITAGLGEAATRALAATVRPVPGRSDGLTLDPRPGFVPGRPAAGGLGYTVAFRPDADRSWRRQLTVMCG